jgi:hypothetical protein
VYFDLKTTVKIFTPMQKKTKKKTRMRSCIQRISRNTCRGGGSGWAAAAIAPDDHHGKDSGFKINRGYIFWHFSSCCFFV